MTEEESYPLIPRSRNTIPGQKKDSTIDTWIFLEEFRKKRNNQYSSPLFCNKMVTFFKMAGLILSTTGLHLLQETHRSPFPFMYHYLPLPSKQATRQSACHRSSTVPSSWLPISHSQQGPALQENRRKRQSQLEGVQDSASVGFPRV